MLQQKLNNWSLLWTILGWIALALLNYYIFPFYFLIIESIFLPIFLLVWTIVQIAQMIREKRELSWPRVKTFAIVFGLFLLTYNGKYVNQTIEKLDWKIFYKRRAIIVEKVKQGEFDDNGSSNVRISKLPYNFPVVSNGGNEIMISENDSIHTLTITFWAFRNFFSSPSTHFVYTDDAEEIERIHELIERNPDQNWKLAPQWYRTYHE